MDLGDLNVVASVGAYRLWANTIINATADNMTVGAIYDGVWLVLGEPGQH